ncbi:MAG TPA: choice-of-anchor Q domain-containing protein [Chitinophagaceae bacterium]
MTRIFLLLIIAVAAFGCSKNDFITSPDAYLSTSADSLHFDTVFTTTGSVTRSFKIFNPNDGKLKLSKVELAGGSASAFRLNVDGTAGTSFTNVEIEAGDSIYAFVTVSINQNSANLPFLIRDSIAVSWNGKTRYVQLDAFGRNAHFFRNRRVISDTSWNNDLPYVIIGGLQVDAGRTLTISKGTRIYVHADAPIIVDGTLKAIGEKADSTRIVFQGDRLDEPYRDYPGSWPGIVFRTSSRDNELQFVTIRNAYQGVVSQNPAAGGNPKLVLNECIFHNIYDVAVGGLNSSINARNCQITQSGYNVFLVGGNYYFNHCTIVSYGSYFLQHKNPVLVLSDISGGTPLDVTAIIRNTIIYGEGGNVDDEILVNRKAPTALFNVQFDNVLYKMKNADPAGCSFTGTKIRNQPPGFDSINTSKPFYNFRLRAGSKAVDIAGTFGTPLFDLDGNPRNTGAAPDLGAYERQ